MFTAAAESAHKGDTVHIGLQLDHAPSAPVHARIAYGGTAVRGSNFTGASCITIPAASTALAFDIAIVSDALYDPNLTIEMTLTAGAGLGVGTLAVNTLTVVNDVALAAYDDANFRVFAGSSQSDTLTANAAARLGAVFAVRTPPVHGRVQILDANAGTYAYTPNNGYAGSDSFDFTVRVGDQSAAGAVDIHVVAQPQPVVRVPANRVYGLQPLAQGTPASFAVSADANAIAALQCTYASVDLHPDDPSFAAPRTDCNLLPSQVAAADGTRGLGSASFDGNTLSWIPTGSQRGTFAFTLTAAGAPTAGVGTFYVTVVDGVDGVGGVGGVGDLQSPTAAFAGAYANSASGVGGAPTSPRAGAANNTDPWPDLNGGVAAALQGFAQNAAPWVGTGAGSAPYALSLNEHGGSDAVNFGAGLSGATVYRVAAWLAAANPAAANAVVLSNAADSNGSGLTLIQSVHAPNRLEVWAGPHANPNYAVRVLGDAPLGYWRLDESNSPFVSAVNSADDGLSVAWDAAPGAVTARASGALVGDTDGAAAFAGSTHTWVSDPCNLLRPSVFSIEAWFMAAANGSAQVLVGSDPVAMGHGFDLRLSASGQPQFNLGGALIGGGVVTAPDWHHLVGTYDGARMQLYVDGRAVAAAAQSTPMDTDAALALGSAPDGSLPLTGALDEVALYDYVLSAQQVDAHRATGQGTPPAWAANAVDDDHPVAHWRLQETAGHTAADSTLAHNDLTLFNVQLAGSTHDGLYAAAFDANSYAWAPASSDYAWSAGSVEIWARPEWVNSPDHAPVLLNLGETQDTRLRVQLVPSSTLTGDFDQVLVSSQNAGSVSFSKHMLAYVWHHFVLTFSNGECTLFVDGAPVDTTASVLAAPSGAVPLYLGLEGADGSNPFVGDMQDIALFNRPLSAQEVVQHFAHPERACQSVTRLSPGVYQQVAITYDDPGATVGLYVNGTQECSMTANGGVSSAGLYAGALGGNSALWSGTLASLKIFANDTAVLDPNAVFRDYAASANRYRSFPQEDAVFQNAIYDFDAQNAGGLAPRLDGLGHCTAQAEVWNNLAAPHSAATLDNLSACGWQGRGVPADPFRLALQEAGGKNAVQLPSDSTDWSGGLSLEVWANPQDTVADAPTFVDLGQAGHANAIIFGRTGGATADNNDLLLSIDTGATQNQLSAPGAVITGAWHQYVATVAPRGGSVDWHLYRDGVELTDAVVLQGGPTVPPQSLRPFNFLGRNDVGDLAVVRVYNSGLSPAQVRQNCVMQSHRFGVTCP